MKKKMLINATHPEENRVAIVEEGILTELDIEIAGKEQTRSNIYQAVVVRVEPGLQAAFIDYGADRLGFLQMGEIHPSYFRTDNGEHTGRPRITDVLRRGQELLVQVVKEERGTKGAALTTFLSLPGRYMVLMPESDSRGVSRKIEDEPQRKKLKEIMASLDLPPHLGYIVRTAAIGQKKEELKRDFDYLVRVYENIKSLARQTKAPALVYKESNLVIRSIRDYFSADMDEVLVDDPKVFEEARDFFQQVMPEYARLVKLHQERRPIFARYQIEEQIETIYKNKVPLPSGGSIVIDATEALVAVDVNSGKMAGEQGVESTAFKTNLEAAAEVGRQLRLRDLGGLVVIDFIDMRERKHIREVEKALKDALKMDKARVTVGRISQFGLLEMSRQRIKAALAEGSYLPCPHCFGSGKIKSAEAQGIALLRKIHAALAKGQIGRVEGEVPLEVATYLLNVKRQELLDLERQHQVTVIIHGRPDFIAGQNELTVQKREKDETPLDAANLYLTGLALPPAIEAPTRPEKAEEAPSPEAPAAAEAGETAPEAGRKKRKRNRRRKKGEEARVETAAEAQPAAPEAEQPVAEPAAADEQAAERRTEQPLAAAETAGEERRKKRRRRRKKKPVSPVEQAAALPQALASLPSAPVPAVITAPVAAIELAANPERAEGRQEEAAAAQEAKKPAKGRRRAPNKPAAEKPGETTPPEKPAAEAPPAAAAAPAADPSAGEAAKAIKKKAPRRPGKATRGAPEAERETPAAAEEKAPAASRRRKPAPAKATEAQGEQDPAQDKPTPRRRSPRRPKAPVKTEIEQ